MATSFKLKRDGENRRVTFNSYPTWLELAEKINSLYAIPLDKVAVSYVDAEDDEVTLSTNEELQDYYQATHIPGEVFKFSVRDLGAVRSENKALPQTPRSNVRNTFGREPLPFDLDQDWQIPTFDGASPHGYVETVPSSTAPSISAHNESGDNQSDAHSISHSGNDFLTPHVDKGKGRALSSFSSTPSLLASNNPSKPDLHVFDIGPAGLGGAGMFDFAPSPASTPRSSVHSSLGMESTPKANVQNLDTAPSLGPESVKSAKSVGTARAAEAASENETPDPPLPSLDSATPHANPSLSYDVAALLNTLTGVISSHPELSEGIRNILFNAANGSYWTAQRDSIHEAASNLQQSVSHAAAVAEDEAGRRVAESLGTIFRSFSQVVGPLNIEGAMEPVSSTPVAEESNRPSWGAPPFSTSFWYGPPLHGPPHPHHPPPRRGGHSDRGGPHHPFARGPPGFGGWGHPHHGPPGAHHGPPGPRHGSPGPHLGPPGPRHGSPGPHHGPPGPPPPPPPPRSRSPHRDGHHHPPPPPPPPGTHPGWIDGEHTWGVPPPPPPPADFHPRPKPTPQELRAQVEAAKLLYKAEKERYRQERDERKAQRERQMQQLAETANEPVAPARPEENLARRATVTQIVSNARGPYPQLEMFNVPRRHNTHTGHVGGSGSFGRRRGADAAPGETPASRASSRINKKLADMGFSENTHPEIPDRIQDQLPKNGAITKEVEDDIVTTLLEELIVKSPKPPVPSGSGIKDDIPGAWH